MTVSEYSLYRLTDEVFAFVHPRGPWGVNNTGLICNGDASSALVDTLFTTALTEAMVEEMKTAAHAAHRITTVLNTHANGDHCWGNAVFKDAEIISTNAAADEMKKVTPAIMRKLLATAEVGKTLGPAGRALGTVLTGLGVSTIGSILRAAPFLVDIFGAFDFSGTETLFPNRTFAGELTLHVGRKEVELHELGPAHTAGDFLVFVPEDKVLFAGDLLFSGAHPLLWEGPVSNWIAACDKMTALKADHVVPGHGPITDADGILRHKHYFQLIAEQARKLFDGGVPLKEAVLRMDLGPLADLTEPERLIVNMETLYREFRGEPPRKSVVPCFALMADYQRELNKMRHCAAP